MRKYKLPQFAVWLLLAAFLAAFAGCAGAGNQNLARGLNQDEAEKLLALHSARQKNREQNSKTPADPKRLEAHGDGLALAGDWMGALFQYHRALGLAPSADRQRLRAKTAEVCLRARQFAQAEALFKEMAGKNPKQAAFWQGLGLAYMGQGKQDEAGKALKKATAIKPSLWKAQNALGIIHNQKRRPDLALKRFDLALTYGPKRAELYNNRGMALLLLGKEDKAAADFRRATAADPDSELAHNNLALLMAKKGRLKEALKYFSKGSGTAQAHNNLGCLLAWKGSFRKASKHFQTALSARPRYYPLAGQHLAQVEEGEPGPYQALHAADYQTAPAETKKPASKKPVTKVKTQKPVKKVSLRKKPRAKETESSSSETKPQAKQASDQKTSKTAGELNDPRPADVPPLGMVALVKDSKVVKGVWVEKEGGVRSFAPKPGPGRDEPVTTVASKVKVKEQPEVAASPVDLEPSVLSIENEAGAVGKASAAPEPSLAQSPVPAAVSTASTDQKAAESLKIHQAEADGSPAVWRGKISFDPIQNGSGATMAEAVSKSGGQIKETNKSAMEEEHQGDGNQISGALRLRPIGG